MAIDFSKNLKDIKKDAEEYERRQKASGVKPNETIGNVIDNGVGIKEITNENINPSIVSNFVHGISDTAASAVDLATLPFAISGNQDAMRLIGSNEAEQENIATNPITGLNAETSNSNGLGNLAGSLVGFGVEGILARKTGELASSMVTNYFKNKALKEILKSEEKLEGSLSNLNKLDAITNKAINVNKISNLNNVDNKIGSAIEMGVLNSPTSLVHQNEQGKYEFNSASNLLGQVATNSLLGTPFTIFHYILSAKNHIKFNRYKNKLNEQGTLKLNIPIDNASPETKLKVLLASLGDKTEPTIVNRDGKTYFTIKDSKLGKKVAGTIDNEGNILIDTKVSQLSDSLYRMGLTDKEGNTIKLLEPVDNTNDMNIVSHNYTPLNKTTSEGEPLNKNIQPDTKELTDTVGSDNINEINNIKQNKENVSNITSKNNAKYLKDNHNIISQTTVPKDLLLNLHKNNITDAIDTISKSNEPRMEKVGKVLNLVKSIRNKLDPSISLVNIKTLNEYEDKFNKDIENEESLENKSNGLSQTDKLIRDTFFYKDETGKYKPKADLVEAIKNIYAYKALKKAIEAKRTNDSELLKIEPKDIAQDFMNVLGIKDIGSGSNAEALKGFIDKLTHDTTEQLDLQDKSATDTKRAIFGKIDNNTKSAIDKEIEQSGLKNDEISKALTDITGEPEKLPKIIKRNKEHTPGSIDMKYNTKGKFVTKEFIDYANAMADTAYVKTNNADKIFEYYKDLQDKVNSGDKEAIKKLLKIKDKNLNTIQKEEIQSIINDFNKEMDYISYLKDHTNNGDKLIFDVEILDQKRAQYSQEINPQNSGILMDMFRPQRSNHNPSIKIEDIKKPYTKDTKIVEMYKKSFGKEPTNEDIFLLLNDTMFKDPEKVDKIINNGIKNNKSDKEIIDNVINNDDLLIDKTKSLGSLIDRINIRRDKKGIIYEFGTTDAKASNLANVSALMSINNRMTAIGSDTHLFSDDIRNQIADEIKSTTNLELTKDDIKPLFTGIFYEGDPLGLMGQEFGDKIFNKWASNPNDKLTKQLDNMIQNKIDLLLSNLSNEIKETVTDPTAMDNFLKQYKEIRNKLFTLEKDASIDYDSIQRSLNDLKEKYSEYASVYKELGYIVSLIKKRNYGIKDVKNSSKDHLINFNDEDKLFINTMFKNIYGNQIANIIESKMVKNGLNDIKEFRETNKELYKLAKIKFMTELMRERFDNTTDINQLLSDIKKDLGDKFNTTNIELIKKDLEQLKSFSIHDLMTVFAKYNVLTEDIMKWKRLEDIIPYVDGYSGNKIPMAQFSSNMIHMENEFSSFDVGSVGFFRIYSPIYTIAHDSILMSKAFTKIDDLNAVNRYDALYGDSTIIKGGSQINKELSQIFLNTNIATNFLKLNHSLRSSFLEPAAIPNGVLDHIAKQEILKSNGNKEINNENIQEEIEKISSMFDRQHTNEIQRKLKELEQNINNRRTKTISVVNKGKEIHFNNFQLEANKANVEKLTDFTLNNNNIKEDYNLHDITFIEPKQTETFDFKPFTSINKKVYKNVNPNGNKSFTTLSDASGNKSNYSFNIGIEFDNTLNNHAQIEIINKVQKKDLITGKFTIVPNDAIIKFSSAVYKADYSLKTKILFHELSHIAFDLLSNRSNEFRIDLDGLARKIQLNASEIGLHIKDNNLETIVDTLSNLYRNEVILTNRRWFANFVKNGDLEPLLDLDNYTLGSDIKLNTLTDLIKAFDNADNSEIASTLKDYRDKFNAMINQPNIQALLMNKLDVVKDFFSNDSLTMHETTKDGNKIPTFLDTGATNIVLKQENIKNFVNSVKEMSISQIFRIDAQREAIEKGMAQALAAQSELSTFVDNIRQKVNSLIDNISLPNVDEDKQVWITKTMLLGFHKVINTMKDEKGNFISSNKFLDTLASNNKQLMNELAKILNLRNSYGLKTKELEKLIDKFNSLKYNGGIIDPIAFLDNITKDENYNQLKAKDYLEKIIAYKRINKLNDSSPELFRKYYNDIRGSYNRLQELYTVANNREFKNNNILFGINPRSMLHKYNKIVVLSDNPEGSLGHIDVQLKEPTEDGRMSITKYITVKSKNDFRIGEQKGQIVLPFTNDIQKGILSSFDTNGKIFQNGKTYETDTKRVYITTHHINKINDEIFDFDIGSSFVNNAYNKFVKEILWQKTAKQWDILSKNGIIISANKYTKLGTAQKDFWKPVSNDLIKNTFGNWYVKKDYVHYINGTEGVHIEKLLSNIMNPDTAKTLVAGIKAIVAAIDIAKELIIKYRPKAYINQYISAQLVNMINSKDPRLYTTLQTSKYVRTKLEEYRTLKTQKVDLVTDLSIATSYTEKKSIEQKLKAINDKLNKSEIGWAIDNGIGDTIVQDFYDQTTSTSKRFINEVLQHGQAKSVIDSLDMIIGNKSKIGKATFTLMSEMELKPKIALFMSNYTYYKSMGISDKIAKEKALGDVLMANPTYNNLPTALAIYDNFSPFTKYYASIPKMLLTALVKSPKRFLAINAAIIAGTKASWALSQGQNQQQVQWYQDNGFMNMPGTNIVASIYAMDPFLLKQYVGINGALDPKLTFDQIISDPIGFASPITVMKTK